MPRAMLSKKDLEAIGALIDEKVDSKIDPLAAAVASGFADVYRRFDQVDSKFDQIDSKFGQTDSRFEQIDRCLDRIEDRVDSIALDVVDVKTRLGRVEKRIDGLAVTVFGRA